MILFSKLEGEEYSVDKRFLMSTSWMKVMIVSGPAKAGVQSVRLHTHFFAPCLCNVQVLSKKFGFKY